MTDLQDQPGCLDQIPKSRHLFNGNAQGLLTQDVLAGLQRRNGCGNMERIGRRDDHGLQLRVSEHGRVVRVSARRPMDLRHSLHQVSCDVTDRI